MIIINTIAYIGVKRGILSPNEFWWNISDMMADPTGVKLFYKIGKQTHSQFYKTRIFGTSMILVLDADIIKIILDNSPDKFSVGILKYNFFKTFMRKNIGMLSDDIWKDLREMNEDVLDTGNKHHLTMHNQMNNIISQELSSRLPTNFTQFNQSAGHITDLIVFGKYGNDIVYDAINEANDIPIVRQRKLQSYPASQRHIESFLKNPIDNTLVSILSKYKNGSYDGYLVDQIYHFIFPLIGIMTIHIPRILSLIISHPEVENRFIQEIDQVYLQKCIMESLRLNVPVMSFFRKSEQDSFGFPKGTEFLILTNPILRNPSVFIKPDLYIPDRWVPELMNSHYNLIFGISSQPNRCPGQNLAMDIMAYYLTTYMNQIDLSKIRLVDENIIFMDKPKISYAINPYKIEFKLFS